MSGVKIEYLNPGHISEVTSPSVAQLKKCKSEFINVWE